MTIIGIYDNNSYNNSDNGVRPLKKLTLFDLIFQANIIKYWFRLKGIADAQYGLISYKLAHQPTASTKISS